MNLLLDVISILVLLIVSPIVLLYEKIQNRKTIQKFKIVGNEQSLKVIVFIHGLQDDHTSWSNQVEYFKEHYKCILINRTAGDNETYMDMPEIYSIIKQNTQNVEKINCIAASAGSFPAIEIQKKYNIFNKLILLNILFNYEQSKIELLEDNFYNVVQINSYIYLELLSYSLNRDYFFSYPIWLIGKIMRSWAKRIKKTDVYVDANLIYRKKWQMTLNQRKATAHGYFNSLYMYSNTYRRQVKDTIYNTPDRNVLSMIGTRDNIGHVNTYNIESFAKKNNNNLMLLKGSGHWFYQSNSETTNHHINQFFEGIAPNEFVTYI